MLFSLLSMATLAVAGTVLPSANLARRQDSSKLLVSQSGAIRVITFDGTTFTEAGSYNMSGLVPSWLAFQPPNMIYTYDENSNNTYALSIDLASNTIKEEATAQGCLSPVHLEINKDGNRMVASCYSNGDVSIWDITDGGLKLLKTIHTNGDPIGPGQTVARAHQTVMDPSGRFWATNNLGTDTIVITDGKDDAWEIVNRIRTPAGCGPRHGSWYPLGAEQATHYMVVCEVQNLVHVYKVAYYDTTMQFNLVQTTSTFSQDTVANVTNARAAELVISDDNLDVYVSNRLLSSDPQDSDQDSIVHYRIVGAAAAAGVAPADSCGAAAAADAATGGDIMLKTIEEIPSGGLNPRQIALGSKQDYLFVGNQGRGPAGLAAFTRTISDNGKISAQPVGSVDFSVFGDGYGWGPQFIKQIA